MFALFTKYWFAFFSILIGGVFAVLAEFSQEHNYILFVVYISVMLSILGIWIEIREHLVITEAQVMAFLKKIRFTGLDNIISNNKILEISKIKQELDMQIFGLLPQQMIQYTSDAIRDLLKNGNDTKTYYATHSVNSEKYLHTWDTDSLEDNDRDDFVLAQRELLNAGGQLIRIFIFLRSYFNENKEQCIKMLRRHNEYYKGTAFPVKTMIYFYNSHKDSSLTQDFTIVGNRIVFEWYRSLSQDNDGYGNGKCFTKEEHRKVFIEKFEELRSHSKDFEGLIGK